MPSTRPELRPDSLGAVFSRRSLLVLFLISVVGWYLIEPMVLRREFDAKIRSDQALSELSMEWTRQGDPVAHGVWLDDDVVGAADLEIRPSGVPTKDGTGFEFWLYTVKDSYGNGIDLKAIVASGDPERVSGGWILFEQGPGVVYTGAGPGFLKIPIQTRHATISHAFTPMGGKVEFAFRGQTQVVDTSADANRGGTVVVPATRVTTEATRIARTLPTYRPKTLTLNWKGPIGTTVTIEQPRLVLRLLGWSVGSRSVGLSSGPHVTQSGTGSSPVWLTAGDSPQVRLDADCSAGTLLYVLGWIGTFVALVVGWVAAALAWRGWCWLRVSPPAMRAAVLCLLIGINLLIAIRFPVTVTSDGIDYIDGAAGMAFQPHTLDRILLYKAPGLMFVLAACMRLGKDFLLAFAVFQAIFSVAASVLTYGLLKSRLGWRWATAAALLIGLHPVLVTYQTYLLRENLASMLYLAVGVGFVVLERPPAAERRSWPLAIAAMIGVVCGLGSLVRENFQILLLTAPIAVAFVARGTPARRVTLAAVTLGVAFLTLLPYLAVKCWPNGAVGVVIGKTQANRALNVWTNGVADGNDTAFISQEEWLALREREVAGHVSDFDFVAALRTGDRLEARLADPSVLTKYQSGLMEPLMKEVADEAVARNPWTHIKGVGVSFLNQIGLWNFYDPPDAAGAAWYSRALRGRVGDFSTNYQVGTDWILGQEGYRDRQDQILDLVHRTTRSQESSRTTAWNSLFNEFFWFVHFLRPAVAVLFLVGIYRSIQRGDRAIAALGLTTLFMMGAAAAVVAPSPDRFSAPFIPVMVCLALYAAVTWKDGSARKPSTT